MPPKFEVRGILRALDQASLEKTLTIWDDGRMIVEGQDEVCHKKVPGALRIRTGGNETRRERAGSGRLVICGSNGNKKQDPATPLPLSVGTPGDKRSGPVEDRFREILERRRAESEEESMDETLSETGEEKEVGKTPEPKPAEEDFTAQ